MAVTADGEPEQLAQFAEEEFGYRYDGPVHPMAEQIANGHSALDALGQTAGSIAPPTEQERIAEMEARGDTDGTIAGKGAQLGRMLKND